MFDELTVGLPSVLTAAVEHRRPQASPTTPPPQRLPSLSPPKVVGRGARAALQSFASHMIMEMRLLDG